MSELPRAVGINLNLGIEDTASEFLQALTRGNRNISQQQADMLASLASRTIKEMWDPIFRVLVKAEADPDLVAEVDWVVQKIAWSQLVKTFMGDDTVAEFSERMTASDFGL